MKELVDIVRVWERNRGGTFALATLVRAHGSSYRRPGAHMLIAADGTSVGSLSGGCLEEEVAGHAREVFKTGTPALLEFDTRRRFGCNGTIEIFVELVGADFLSGLAAAVRARQRCQAMTVSQGSDDQLGSRFLKPNEAPFPGAFLQTIEPPIQLIVFGDGPDSSPFRSIAETLGWSVLEVEQAANLPGTADERTAAIIKSHNYGRDFAALRHLLQLNLRYVGLLGPRRRRDQLIGDLVDSGVSAPAELFAPAGFDLGAETPEEIALAITSEIQSVLAAASGEPLRARKAPIHGWNLACPAPEPLEACATSQP